MGKVKDQATAMPEPDVAVLKDEEFNYALNVQSARLNVQQEYNRVISAFLHYIACSRMGYESTDNLQFEIDFDDPERKLKIWKLEENFFNPEGDATAAQE